MTDVIGRGVVAIGADTTGATAGIEKVKKSVKSLGDAADKSSARNSASIDRYVQKLVTQANTFGRTNREIELYTLRMRGASAAQLQAANTALTLIERQNAMKDTIAKAGKYGAIAGAAIAAGATIALHAIGALIEKVASFQGIAEKIGDTASNVASLSVAAAVSGTAMDSVSAAAVKLNKNLLGVDDDSKDAGSAVKYLGLNLKELKSQAPSEQLRTLAKAMSELEDDTSKTNVAVALFGKSGAEMIPFLNDLNDKTNKYNILSAEQIETADKFSKAQARNKEVLQQSIAAFAIEYIPAVNEAINATKDWLTSNESAGDSISVLRGAMHVAGLAFQTIALIASDVAFVFKGVGREIGAIAAQLVALAHLDFKGFNAISEAVKEDAARARKELDAYQARIAALGNDSAQAVDKSYQTLEDRRLKDRKPKRSPFTGGTADSAKKAQEEAKAQLAADLDLIKRQSEGVRAIFAADGKILEAQRSANLISDREYFNAKRNLLIIDQQEQEVALQKEIARLQQEKLTGKDAIENQKKIVAAQQELNKLRIAGAADLKVLEIQEADSIAKVARAYQDAKIAAQEYLATIARRNKAEVGGLGAGNQERERLSGLAAIEDRFLAEKARIERDKRNAGDNEQLKKQLDQYLEVARQTYGEEVKLFNERTDAIQAKQRDWITGYKEALNNYIDASRNIAEQSQHVFENLFSNLEDTISDFVKTGKLNLKGLFDSLASDITKSIVKQKLGELASFAQGNPDSIVGNIMGAIGGLIGGGQGGGAAASAAAGVAGQTAALTANTAAVTASTASISAASASASALAAAEGTAATTIATASTAGTTAITTLATAATAAATALASVAASAGAKGGGDVLGTFIESLGISGSRATGGPVSANKLYRVNERGPELLQVAGKQYLMMGNQAGKVEPTGSSDMPAPNITNVYVTPPAGSSRESAMQWGVTAGRAINRSARRNG